MATMNDMEMKAVDMLNAQVGASVKNVWSKLGQDFGEDSRKTDIIVWTLHALKMAGNTFSIRSHLCMIWKVNFALQTLACERRLQKSEALELSVAPMSSDLLFIHHNEDGALEQLNKNFLKSYHGN